MEDLSTVARQLAAAVELTMDPLAPQEHRMEAYNAVERFKESSSVCAQCGFFLAECPTESPFVQHFGLQLVEHCIKYRWIQMSHHEKLFIKNNVMKMLCRGIDPELSEHTHIKDAVSRAVVEMIKREWPQQWPDLLAELSNASKLGESQTELVLFVFLRLVEDVALLQTLESHQRRKDIHQALTLNMSEIFGFFVQLMETHGNSYRMFIDLQQQNFAYPHARVVKVALQTVAAFVEWVSITHIMAREGRLLQNLCLLLCDREFQMPAAECLLQIVSRKGRVEERKPLLILFSKEPLEYMQQAVGSMVKSFILMHPDDYLFLKKMCQVLSGLGTQLCTSWGREDTNIGRPAYFSLYLSTIVKLIGHESLTIVHSVNSIWMSFFKHNLISRDEVFLEYVPCWVKTIFHKVLKVTYPSSRSFKDFESATAGYACQDYDSEEEFSAFFHRCRTDLLDTYRQAMLVAPLNTFQFVAERLHSYLIRSSPQVACQVVQAPTLLEWEGLAQVLDSVLSRILQCSVRPSVDTGLQLLERCLQYEPSDPLLLSILLSCISALFVFLTMVQSDDNGNGLLSRVLDKIFSALVFTLPGQTKDSRSRVVKNVRRHAASLMVKISYKYPLLLLPMFNRIYGIVQGLNRDPSQLSKMERVTLQEALLLISNHFCNYQQQTKFIEEVIGSGAEQWLAMGSEAFRGPREFMAFVGLDSPPVEPSSDDVNGQNRSHIHFCVNLFMAVVKRCTWPDDPDRAIRGGFCVSQTDQGNPIMRNPAAPHLLPLIPNLLALLRVFNALWTPEALALLSEGYRAAHAMLIVDRTNLLGIGTPSPSELIDVSRPRAQTPLDRMQHFLTMVHDSSYHILGNAGSSLRRDFYSLPDLAQLLIDSVFSNLEVIPDYRLRPIIRVFMKPFISYCPSVYYESVLLPVLAHVCPYMFHRLNNKWQYMSDLFESGSIEDENSDTQEVVDDMLNRTVTREFLDVLKFALVGTSADAGTVAADSMDQDEQPKLNCLLQSELSELGSMILRSEANCQSVVLCIFRALSWKDTLVSLKATFLAAPMIRLLANNNSLTSAAAVLIMVSVLQGLEMHGQHEGNNGSLLALGVQVYEVLSPIFPEVRELMMQVPGCTAAELKKLDEKISASGPKGNKAEKNKKEIFKRITNQLIGRSLGQLFRKEMHIANLPRLAVRQRF